MAEKVQFTDNDMFAAMCKSLNEDLNIDEMCVAAIEAVEENEKPTRWNGSITDYDGLDVLNLKNPVFDKK